MNLLATASLATLILGSGQQPPNTCLTGTIAPRVSKANIAAAVEVVSVTVEDVEYLPYARCRTVMLIESVQRSTRFATGQRFIDVTNCADANTLLPHADELIYSDVPVIGERGHFYVPHYTVVPPGSYYVAERNQAALSETRVAASQTHPDSCSG